MNKFIKRAYNTFYVDQSTKSLLIKKSKEDRLANETEYYKNLPGALSIFFPRLVASGSVDGVYEMYLEYYAYANLGKVLTEDTFNEEFWKQVFSFIKTYISNYKKFEIYSKPSDSVSMFIDKTETEYKKLITDYEFFKKLNDEDYLIVNGEPLIGFRNIWPYIKPLIVSSFLPEKFHFIHGDLCFSNILFGSNPINRDVILKFIDPRGSFGKTKFYGDLYYDLAKLSHSCQGGYEFFITDKFKVENILNKEFTLKLDNQNNKHRIYQLFLDEVVTPGNYDINKINTIEGTIFMGMIARHYDSFERQKAMYLTGLTLLNKVYEKSIKKL